MLGARRNEVNAPQELRALNSTQSITSQSTVSLGQHSAMHYAGGRVDGAEAATSCYRRWVLRWLSATGPEYVPAREKSVGKPGVVKGTDVH